MRIVSLYGGGKPTLSFEFFPPKTDEARDALLLAVDHLSTVRPDFVSVTYGAGGSTRALSFDLCARIQRRTSGITMAHLTGVCHSFDDMSGIADQLWDQGIVNIMALRGDRPKTVEHDVAFTDFPFGKDLIRYLRSRHPFCFGSGCYPEGHPENRDIAVGIDHLKQKIDAGCEFLVTQMFFDNDGYFRFVDRAREAGIETPIVPGIMPVTGFAQIGMFERKFGVVLPTELHRRVAYLEEDRAAVERAGVEWAAEQCRALLAGGAPGIHFYTLNKSRSTVEVCERLGMTGSGAAS